MGKGGGVTTQIKYILGYILKGVKWMYPCLITWPAGGTCFVDEVKPTRSLQRSSENNYMRNLAAILLSSGRPVKSIFKLIIYTWTIGRTNLRIFKPFFYLRDQYAREFTVLMFEYLLYPLVVVRVYIFNIKIAPQKARKITVFCLSLLIFASRPFAFFFSLFPKIWNSIDPSFPFHLTICNAIMLNSPTLILKSLV